jgi:hypothetical protein
MAWGPNFGGDFPKEIYTSIIDEIQKYVIEPRTDCVHREEARWILTFI